MTIKVILKLKRKCYKKGKLFRLEERTIKFNGGLKKILYEGSDVWERLRKVLMLLGTWIFLCLLEVYGSQV